MAALPMARPPRIFKHLMVPINVIGTLNVLDAFEQSPFAKKIIFASSSMAYGHFLEDPQKEDSILNPMNTYGATKAAGEYFVKLSKKNWTIIRPICVYGFTDCANRVTQLLLDAAFTKKEAWIVEGERLDLTYIDDVTSGFIKCLESTKANKQIINISAGKAIPVTTYAEILKKHFPIFSYEIRQPEGEQVNRGGLDITKAYKLLGFKPRYDIERGVKKTIELMKKFGWNESIYKLTA